MTVKVPTASNGAVTDKTGRNPNVHMKFLDGIRGLTALYVVFFHLRGHLPAWASAWTAWSAYGHTAVAVFIVLSGFCLMLPVVQSEDCSLRGGTKGFFFRRAKRILPPYYAALLLSIPFEYIHQRDHGRSISGGAILSHLFLVHNLSFRWNQMLDAPMWSVATEWQIYFFLPFVLLPLFRRFNMAVAAFAAFTLGYLPHLLLPAAHNFDWACPWYLGLFALGMWGAVFCEKSAAKHHSGARSTLWFAALFVTLAAVCIINHALGRDQEIYHFATDPLNGLTTAFLIVACAIGARDLYPVFITRKLRAFLQSRAAIGLGRFSYSLYLTHSLITHTVGWFIDRHLHSGMAVFIARYLLVLPAALAFAYGFYLVFERPMLSVRSAGTANKDNLKAAASV